MSLTHGCARGGPGDPEEQPRCEVMFAESPLGGVPTFGGGLRGDGPEADVVMLYVRARGVYSMADLRVQLPGVPAHHRRGRHRIIGRARSDLHHHRLGCVWSSNGWDALELGCLSLPRSWAWLWFGHCIRWDAFVRRACYLFVCHVSTWTMHLALVSGPVRGVGALEDTTSVDAVVGS